MDCTACPGTRPARAGRRTGPAFGLAAALALLLGACGGAPQPERPTLAVLVVVDQLWADLLVRYDSLFTGGFRRLRDESRQFVNATHDHAGTYTAPGHATLSTGVYPARHGIVSNSWAERVNGEWTSVENVHDPDVEIVGAPGVAGASPHRLVRDGFADWLLAADSASIVVSVSGKDRGAILPAAHTRGYVYWFEPEVGRFVTSTYYRTEDPDWVTAFNRDVLPTHARDSVWESTIPAAVLAFAQPDTSAHEGDGIHTYFPHRFADVRNDSDPSSFWRWFGATPMLDAATLGFAKAAVEALGLGRDGSPDFLSVSLSQTDRVGHQYGPLSREQLDNLLRLDRELGDFFTFLDETVGAGRWVLALSADHGVHVAPEVAQALGRPGLRATQREREALERAVATAQANAKGADDAAVARSIAEAVEQLPFVEDAWTHAELDAGTPPADSFMALYRNSRHPGREAGALGRLGVEVRFVPGFISYPRGATHGSPYYDDRHVPLLFMGPGIPPGIDSTRAATVDLAPTLARLLGIPAPGDLDGKALTW
ncbi:MAG TPA: alkaline phosphatase family protein [Longimicrobiales bacterium]